MKVIKLGTRLPNATISPCVADDLNAIFEIERLCFPPFLRFEREFYAESLKDENIRTFKCLLQPEPSSETPTSQLTVIGGYIFWGGPPFEILTLNIHPEYRRRGIATTLLKEVEKSIPPGEIIRLHVYEKNHAAITLYTGLGYKKGERVKKYYARKRAAFIMEKIINGN